VTLTRLPTGSAVWLLDVDGVINASRPGWSEAPHRGEARAKGVSWTIRWSPSLVKEIRSIVASGVIRVVWTTTWCPWADQLEGMFGLPELPRAFTAAELDSQPSGTLKLAAALEVASAGHRLIWTDDDAIPQGGHDRQILEAVNALLIAPDERRGLQPADVKTIRERLSAWSG
jgi:hypothetical protein